MSMHYTDKIIKYCAAGIRDHTIPVPNACIDHIHHCRVSYLYDCNWSLLLMDENIVHGTLPLL